MFTKIGCKDKDFFDIGHPFRRFSDAKRFIFIFYGDFLPFRCPFADFSLHLPERRRPARRPCRSPGFQGMAERLTHFKRKSK